MSRANFLPFSRPSISEEEIAAVGEVLRSGWITTGPQCAGFENAWREYVGCREAVALSSATAGMHVVLQALEIGAGDEIITPSLTWVSTINLITLLGATPIFVDVDRDTLLVSPEDIEAAITPRTKAIIPVHYAGAPADLEPLRQIARKHNVILIEDAAHAAGTEYSNRRIGATGTSIFSFHPIKNMTTGEGGMISSDDEELMARVRRLKFHGLGVDAFDRQMQGRAPQAEVIEPGYKYNLTDIAAILGLGQLVRLDEFNARRAELVGMYHERLREIPELSPLSVPKYPHRHAWHLFIVRVNEQAKIGRDEFMATLKSRNIGTGLHFRAVHTQKFYREMLPQWTGKLPNTEWNSAQMLSLPLFPAMTEDDLNDVVNAMKDVLVKSATM